MIGKPNAGGASRSIHALIAILMAAGAQACVGSEDGGTVRKDDRDVRDPSATSFGRDTAKAVSYYPVELVVDSEEPRKVTLHLIVTSEPTRAQKGATLRAALDSLSKADSALAAARAILYTGRRTPEAVDFIAAAWAEWVPPQGFQAAPVRSESRIYRIYVFHADPGWDGGRDVARESRQSDA